MNREPKVLREDLGWLYFYVPPPGDGWKAVVNFRDGFEAEKGVKKRIVRAKIAGTQDAGGRVVAIELSTKTRTPTIDEVISARDGLLGPERDGVIIVPPRSKQKANTVLFIHRVAPPAPSPQSRLVLPQGLVVPS